jgi:hypothetical protein
MVRRKVIAGMGVIATLLLTFIAGSSWLVNAAGPQPLLAHEPMLKAPVLQTINTSLPLHQPLNAPSLSTMTAGATISCPKPTIDLRLLVLASDGNEADLPAIRQTLDYLGTPYTVYIASKTPGGLTAEKLNLGCHGYYQGVILTNGTLVYNAGQTWISALTQQEWTNLWRYETLMNVRQLSWYTYPTPDFGYQPPNQAINTSNTTLTAKLTIQGQPTFPYLNKTALVPIQNVYTYLAKPLTDGATIPILSDANGNSLGAIRFYSNGRQVLSLTFDSNPNLVHSLVLSYGLVNWLTKGIFLGERHIYASPQVDNLFLANSDWQSKNTCNTSADNTGSTYRITGDDLQTLINWQKGKQAASTSSNLTLTMAYNAYGTTPNAYNPDTLTPAAKSSQAQLNWVSHTYTHSNLDTSSYSASLTEIKQNNLAANTLQFTRFSPRSLITPDLSGLTNPNFLKAAYDSGIRYLLSDASKPAYTNPSPNAGIYNSSQPQILLLPARPNNLFYNVSTPAAWVAEFNCLYQRSLGKTLTYKQILDIESQTLLLNLLKGDCDPWMFHQSNLRAYDGVHSLLSDLLDITMQKYTQYYTLRILSPSMDTLGTLVTQRMQYDTSGVSASIIPGVSLTIHAQKAARIPITGLLSNGAESYGGQHISHLTLSPGQSLTIPL